MSIICEIQDFDNNIEKTKLEHFLDKSKIVGETIEIINSILSIDNLDEVFSLIEKYIENGRIIYKKYGGDVENKEKIIDFILKNISRLLNEVNVERVYNSSSCLSINDFSKLSLSKQLKDLFIIKGSNIFNGKITGGSCNNWVILIKGLITSLTLDDKDIKYSFQVNVNDNHGILYMIIGQKKYSFESKHNSLSFSQIELKKEKSKIFHKKFLDTEDYKKAVILGGISKNTLTYRLDEKMLKIVRKFGFITIGYRKSKLRYLNVHGFKRLTKNISKIFLLQYFGKVPVVYNLDQIKDFIISNANKEDIEDIKGIINEFHDEKLLDFFN